MDYKTQNLSLIDKINESIAKFEELKKVLNKYGVDDTKRKIVSDIIFNFRSVKNVSIEDLKRIQELLNNKMNEETKQSFENLYICLEQETKILNEVEELIK